MGLDGEGAIAEGSEVVLGRVAGEGGVVGGTRALWCGISSS